ncbi:transposon Tf2-8 polyprotein [Trichonephila clavipes]|nr:transposon Tf2-8 polyprotein [Trichonephila clavipes]
MKLSLLISHASVSATPRWSDSSLETPWREDAEQLRYAQRHWSCTGYYGMGRYWISLSHSSSTHCGYFNIIEVLEPVILPYLQGLATAIFQQDNASPPAYPGGNGQVERIHRTLIPVLTKLSIDDPTKWYKFVDRLQRILNSTSNRGTKWSPFELLTGVTMRNKKTFTLLMEEMVEELQEQRKPTTTRCEKKYSEDSSRK